MTHHASLDDHPAAVFGLIVGSLAVLVTLLVFLIYDSAREASKARLHGQVPQNAIVGR